MGCLALWQNTKLFKVNDRLLKLEKNRDKPFIKLLSIDSEITLGDFFLKIIHLRCIFKNIGKGFSIDTCFFAPDIKIGGETQIIHSENEYDNVFIDVGEEKEFRFTFKNVSLKDCETLFFQINIHTEDINSIETKQIIESYLHVVDATKVEISNIFYITSKEYCDYTDE